MNGLNSVTSPCINISISIYIYIYIDINEWFIFVYSFYIINYLIKRCQRIAIIDVWLNIVDMLRVLYLYGIA
jgi:hypothetical protein